MTVYTTKPAINLREELASLRNQGGYSEQQFYFDGLVTNGTFDADTTGWVVRSGCTISAVGGRLRLTATGTAAMRAYTTISTEIGKVYEIKITGFNLSGAQPAVYFQLGGGGSNIDTATLLDGSEISLTVTATSTTHRVEIGNSGANTVSSFMEADNISVFEVDANGDVIHTMPKGWKPKDVFEDGLLQREGAANDYTVVYDGFDYYVKPTVAPSATTQTCVIGVRA